MATEILVNDGGAPARILPFTAGEAISAGEPVMMHTNGKLLDTVAQYAMLGIAFNAAAADGDPISVITGTGSIVRAICSNGTAVGDYMKVGDAKLTHVNNATSAEPLTHVAIALEANASGGDALTKVLLL